MYYFMNNVDYDDDDTASQYLATLEPECVVPVSFFEHS